MLQSWAGLKDPYFGPGITKYSLIQSKRVDGLWIAHLGSASAHRTTTKLTMRTNFKYMLNRKRVAVDYCKQAK
jgi:hypothetical protein